MFQHAIFSPDRTYRYVLERRWSSVGKPLLYIGLNPSTADESTNDPTIRRCINFAKSWNFPGLIVCNLFAFRATIPADLFKANDPVGPQNDKHIKHFIEKQHTVFIGWGNHGAFQNRAEEVLSFLDDPKCIKITKLGFPQHPLYLRKDSVLKDYK